MVRLWISSFIFLYNFTFRAYAQEKSMYGQVIDKKTRKGISNINILNTRTKQVVATNESGDFYLRAVKGDSILITSLGYDRMGIKWDGINKNPKIESTQQAIMLDELLVKDKSIDGLNYEIIEFLENPRNSETMKKDIRRKLINPVTSQPGLGISIDALYDRFSKEGKQNRKLADLQYTDTKKFYAGLKYNKQIAANITKLEGEDLDTFMNFCKPSDDFILEATDYELTFRILRCLNDFRYRTINGTIEIFKKK